jgi:hypothetical protein
LKKKPLIRKKIEKLCQEQSTQLRQEHAEKKSLTVQKVTGEEVKTYGPLQKINGKKVKHTLTVIERIKNVNLEHYGLIV